MLENSAKLFVMGIGFSGMILFVIYVVGKISIVIRKYIDDKELDRLTQRDHMAAIRDDGKFV
jgi:Na+-transporting methylmalonyl-CoA/oxaloacetate decarboxylase gamma subunit